MIVRFCYSSKRAGAGVGSSDQSGRLAKQRVGTQLRHNPRGLPVRSDWCNHGRMNDSPIEFLIDVPTEAKRVIERAAAERRVSVPEFLQNALRKYLVDAGYLQEKSTR